MNSIGRAWLTGCLLACTLLVTGEGTWSFPTVYPNNIAANQRGSCDSNNSDQQLVDSLIEQLGIAQRQNGELKDQLHRQSHGTKARTHMGSRNLQQALQARESQWRQEIAKWQTRCNQQLVAHQQQEAVWRQGVKQLNHLVQQCTAVQQTKQDLASLQQSRRFSDGTGIDAPSLDIQSDQTVGKTAAATSAAAVKAIRLDPHGTTGGSQGPATDPQAVDTNTERAEAVADQAGDLPDSFAALLQDAAVAASQLQELRGIVLQLESSAQEVKDLQQRREELVDVPGHLLQLRQEVSDLEQRPGQETELQAQAHEGAVALQDMHGNLCHMEQQEEELDRLRGKLCSKLELLKEQARGLEALKAEKRQLEEEVAQLQAAAGDLDTLRQKHEQLTDQVAECERQAAINSELRLISLGLDELQDEHMQLKPLAEQAQELRKQIKQLEQDAAALPSIKGEHALLLEQVQQLEELRKENAEMAHLVAQLAVLRRDQHQLQELCQEVELLRADNSLLLSKSQRLPALQQEHEQLQVAVQEVEDLAQQIANLEADAERLQHLRAKVAELRAIPADLAATKQELQQVQATHDQLTSLAQQTEDLSSNIAQLRQRASDLESLRAEHQQLHQKTLEATELRVQISKMQELVGNVPALQEELKQLQEVHNAAIDLSRQLHAKAAEISKLQAERAALTATVEGAEQLQAELEDLRSRAREAVQVQQQLLELQAAQEQLQERKAQIRQLQGTKEELEALLQQHSGLMKAVAASQAQYDELVAAAQRAAQLEAETADLREKVAALEELQIEHRKLTQLAERVQQLRALNARLSQEVQHLPELKKEAEELQQKVVQLQHLKRQIERLQAEGDAAYDVVQHHGSALAAVSGSDLPMPTATSSNEPAPRLSAAHISTTTLSATTSAREDAADQHSTRGNNSSQTLTPSAADVTRALLNQLGTPATAAQQLAAQLAVTPSVLTPGVAAAMADAGLLSSNSTDAVRAKLAALKEAVAGKMERMKPSKRAAVEAQMAKLERGLDFVEQQRDFAEQALRNNLSTIVAATPPGTATSLATEDAASLLEAPHSSGSPPPTPSMVTPSSAIPYMQSLESAVGSSGTPLGFGFSSGGIGRYQAISDSGMLTPQHNGQYSGTRRRSDAGTPYYTPSAARNNGTADDI